MKIQVQKSSFSIITIDGPVGSGKTTVASRLSKRLNFTPIYTGLFYRLFALIAATSEGTDSNAWSIPDWKQIAFRTKPAEGEGSQKFPVRCFFRGIDVTEKLCSPEISEQASLYSEEPKVREIVNHWVRQMVETITKKGIVAEGRDCGSVLFTDADLKVFLSASPEIRVRRLHQNAPGQSLEMVREAMRKRDTRDSSRECAPLTILKGKNAFLLDSSFLTVEEVVEEILDVWRNIRKTRPY